MPGAGFSWRWGHSHLINRDQKPGQIFRNAFLLGTEKARPAETSLVEQLGHDTSPGIAGSEMRSCAGLPHGPVRCGLQCWSLHCLQHHVLSQSPGSASLLVSWPGLLSSTLVGAWGVCPQPDGAGWALPHINHFPLPWNLAPFPWRGADPSHWHWWRLGRTVLARAATSLTKGLGLEAGNEQGCRNRSCSGQCSWEQSIHRGMRPDGAQDGSMCTGGLCSAEEESGCMCHGRRAEEPGRGL